jgi:hypothetical protein
MKLVHILYTWQKILGKQHKFKLNFNTYLCERVVINYQKGRD